MADQTRFPRTRNQRADFFLARGGRCEVCGSIIRPGDAWDIDHIVPKELGGSDDWSNLRLILKKCHIEKTKGDQSTIAKSNRQRAGHVGARSKSTMPGSRDSQWKRKVTGEWVRR